MQPPKMPLKKSKRQKSPSQRYVPWFSRFNDLATHLSLFHTFRCNLRFYHHHFEFSFPYICEYTLATYSLHSQLAYMLVYVYTQLLVVVGLWSFCLCRTTNVYQHFGILKIFRLFFRKLARALLVFFVYSLACSIWIAMYSILCYAVELYAVWLSAHYYVIEKTKSIDIFIKKPSFLVIVVHHFNAPRRNNEFIWIVIVQIKIIILYGSHLSASALHFLHHNVIITHICVSII